MKRLSVTTSSKASRRARALAGGLLLALLAARVCTRLVSDSEGAGETGAVNVECPRRDARVFLDGAECGSAPVLISPVQAGNHQLVVIAPGLQAFVLGIRVEPGVTLNVRAEPRPFCAAIFVTTAPPGADVSIDGRSAGKSPVEVADLPRGRHVVGASLPGYVTREKEVVLDYGEELSVFLSLEKKDATVSVFSFPPGAKVFLDGREMGVTPLTLRTDKDVAAGQHVLRVEKGEGCAHEEPVTVVQGRDLVVDVTLPADGALVCLDPGPAGREIWVDGRLFGKADAPKHLIAPGEHAVKVTGWKGSVLYQRRLNLEKGKSYRLAVSPRFHPSLQLKGHVQGVLCAAFVPGGTTLASGSKDGTVRLWNAEAGTEVLTFKAHPLGVQAVAFDPGGKVVATGGWDKAVRTWDAATGAKLREFDLPGAVGALEWSPCGRYVAAACADATLRVWQVGDDWKALPPQVLPDVVNSIAFLPQGGAVAAGCADGGVSVWRLADFSQAASAAQGSPVKAICISRDGKLLAAGCEDGHMRIHEIRELRCVRCVRVQPNWVSCLSAGWWGVFAAGGDGNAVCLADAEAGRLSQVEEMGGPASALAFDATGRRLAAGSSSGEIRLWLIE